MGVGILEFVVIGLVVLVLFGPDKMPEIVRQLGRLYVQLRRNSLDFKSAVDKVIADAEQDLRLEEIRKLRQLADDAERRAVAEAERLGAGLVDDVKETPVDENPKLTVQNGSLTAAPMPRDSRSLQGFDEPQSTAEESQASEVAHQAERVKEQLHQSAVPEGHETVEVKN
jgi:sec-independent protein translocase protein TatB